MYCEIFAIFTKITMKLHAKQSANQNAPKTFSIYCACHPIQVLSIQSIFIKFSLPNFTVALVIFLEKTLVDIKCLQQANWKVSRQTKTNTITIIFFNQLLDLFENSENCVIVFIFTFYMFSRMTAAISQYHNITNKIVSCVFLHIFYVLGFLVYFFRFWDAV